MSEAGSDVWRLGRGDSDIGHDSDMGRESRNRRASENKENAPVAHMPSRQGDSTPDDRAHVEGAAGQQHFYVLRIPEHYVALGK